MDRQQQKRYGFELSDMMRDLNDKEMFEFQESEEAKALFKVLTKIKSKSKADIERKRVVDDAFYIHLNSPWHLDSNAGVIQYLGDLYDKGYLKMPEDK